VCAGRLRPVDALSRRDRRRCTAAASNDEIALITAAAVHSPGRVRPPEPPCRLKLALGWKATAACPPRSAAAGSPGRRLRGCRPGAGSSRAARRDAGALELIADRVTTNIRALEGALIRVVAFGSLTRRPVTAELAAEVLAGLYPDLQPRRKTIEDIQRQTCAAFEVSLEDLLSASRAQRVALARQFAMYLARELTDETLPAIGRAFGNRNHTTVMHACRRTAERIASDPDAYEAVRKLTEALGGR
jgi:hypothetical protein